MKRAMLALSLAVTMAGLVTGCERSRVEYAVLEWQKPDYDFDRNLKTQTYVLFMGDKPRRMLCLEADEALNEAAKYGWRVVGVDGHRYTLERFCKPSARGRFVVVREQQAMPPSTP